MPPPHSKKTSNLPKYFLLGGLLALMITLIWIISPFIPSIVIGAVIATGFYPVHSVVLKKVKGRRTIATLISLFVILAVVLVPVSWFISYITGQAIDMYLYIELKVETLLSTDFHLIPKIIETNAKFSEIYKYLQNITNTLPIKTTDVVGFITTLIQNVSQFLMNQSTNIAKELSVLAVHFFVLILSIFFFLRDGDLLVQEIKDILPMAQEYRKILFDKLRNMSKGILYGIFGAAMFQGFLGGIGFALAGIGDAAFWGTVMAFFAIVPYIGSTIIWVPAVIILLATGHWIAALFLALWGTFIVGTVDNLIKPLVIGEKARIHPLLSFITILGGIFTMGLPGLIIAPYLLSLCLTFLHIYKLEYQKVLKGPGA
ncbi:MAG: AI-2E family transporter [Candidatus Gracilibacteria bacterium]